MNSGYSIHFVVVRRISLAVRRPHTHQKRERAALLSGCVYVFIRGNDLYSYIYLYIWYIIVFVLHI